MSRFAAIGVALALLFSVLVGLAAARSPSYNWGYVGCSNTHDAMYGYQHTSTRGAFWPWTDYPIEGATVHDWANPASPYWSLFDAEISRYGAPSLIFFQACADLNPHTRNYYPLSLSELEAVVAEIRARVPGAALYVGPLQDYAPPTECSMMGRNAEEIPTYKTWLSMVVDEGEAIAGPGIDGNADLGPLGVGTIWPDGCHPTGDPQHRAPFEGSGAQLLGEQLVAFFDGK